MADSLEEAHQGRQPRPHQTGLAQFVGKSGHERSFAMSAPLFLTVMLLDSHRNLQQFNLLQCARRFLKIKKFPTTTRALLISPSPVMIEFVRSKGRSQMPLVPRLAPSFPLLGAATSVLLFRRIHDIAGGWLGRVSRMLLGLCQFRLERSHARFQFRATRTSVFRFAIRHDGG